MPGVAQLWLTDDELGRIENWHERFPEPVTYADWAIVKKIRAAREAVACPTTPAKEDTMIKTDGKPTIAWDPRPTPTSQGIGCYSETATPPPPLPGPSVEREELDVIGALTLAP